MLPFVDASKTYGAKRQLPKNIGHKFIDDDVPLHRRLFDACEGNFADRTLVQAEAFRTYDFELRSISDA